MSCVPINPCPITADFKCIYYTGPNIACLDIRTNDRLDEVVLKFVNAICNMSSPTFQTNGINNTIQDKLNLVSGNNIALQETNGNVTISANVTIGDSSTSEVFLADGDFEKTFVAGTYIVSFVLVPPTDFFVDVGTTPAGQDIEFQMPVSSTDPTPFDFSRYFLNTETWYFTNIPTGTTVAIYYKPSFTPLVNQ